MKRAIYILLLFLPMIASSQKVDWESTTVNFGTVGDWNSPPATFSFKNTGNKKLMFLPQRHGREVLVRYPNQAIMPGEVGEIVIQYYTSETGSFSETVEVYSNASNKAERLTVKGNIKSIYANALTACPSFQDAPSAKSADPNVIQVVDAATNRPIPDAQIEVYDRGIRKAVNGTNLDGVAVNWIEPGKYIAVASKSDYEKVEQDIVFTKRDRTQVMYLTRSVVEPVLDEVAIAASVDDRWEEPVRPSKTSFQPTEPDEKLDLGIALNDQLKEAKPQNQRKSSELGITTNQVLREENRQSKVVPVDLGINSNDQWDEPEIETEVAEPHIDMGITTNDVIRTEDRKEPVVTDVARIEKTVEQALGQANEVSTRINDPVNEIPEPEFSSEKFRPNNVLLLLDVSGSMKDDDKMDKLKSAIRRLVLMLREVDVLTMIAYNSDSWELLPPTPVKDSRPILALVDSLQPFGYTNGVKGMETAYESLEKQLIQGGNNQLIIATDGKFNSSKFTEKDALQIVKNNTDKGIVLSIIGFGEDREAGRLMKKLADQGSGSFLQVKDDADPTELLAEEIKARSRK